MMKRAGTVMAGLLLMAGVGQAQQWTADLAHSTIGFQVKHMVISTVPGNFKDFTGTVSFDGKDITKGSAEFTVHVASINTGNDQRDGHLKSDDFFAAEKFPTITFKAKKSVKGDGGKFRLTGDLTIRDVTKEVTFDCEFAGAITDPSGKTRAGFTAAAVINRQDFNVKWSKALDSGGLLVGNDVKLEIQLELVMS
jgi:polyisoprenoid-binding protein YceI